MSEATGDDHVVTSELNDGTLVVYLDAPEVLNSFGDQMLEELGEAFRLADQNDDVKAVILTGRGRAFCAGANTKTVWGAHSKIMSLRKRLSPVILTMAAIEKPVICAVNGVAAGAAMGFMGVCDYRIASDGAKFVPATVKLGIAPDGGMSYFVPRLIGKGRAFQWLTTGEHIDAATALSWGLVEEVVAADKLMERAHELVNAIKEAPGASVALTKRQLSVSDRNSLADQLEFEHRTQDEAHVRGGHAW